MKPSTPMAIEIYFSFQIKASRTNRDGESPIVFRIIYRGQRKDAFTGLHCPAKMWLKKEMVVDRKHPSAATLNRELHKILANAEDKFNRLKFAGEEFTLDDLVNAMKGKTKPPQTLQQYIEAKEEELQQRKGLAITLTTWMKYRRTITYLREYLRINFKNRSLPLSQINAEFITGFYEFLRRQKKNGHNSSSSLMCCLKAMLLPAVKSRVIRINPFESFIMKREQIDRGFLELHELNALEDLKGLSKKMALKRDAFLFACFTGLPYSDINKLNSSHIIKDNDGSYLLKISRTKTGIESIIPLLPKAEAILAKYSPTNDIRDFKWNIPCNQKFNSGLKELAKLAGINKPLFVHLGRHTFATTITLSNGVSLETVAKMLGHSTIKHTQVYAKVVASKVKNEMAAIKKLF